MQCLLVGNYGVGNLGDEALKEYFLTRFPEVDWLVLSASPHGARELPRLPFGLRSFLTTRWWKTLKALRSCDAVVFGGGSLFTDSESVRACMLWWWHGVMARLLGARLLLAFQGIGPFRTRVGEWCARVTVRSAAFVSVRDGESATRTRAWARDRVILSADPVLMLLPDAHHPRASREMLAIIPRQNSAVPLWQAVRNFLGHHTVGAVRILSLQPDASVEQRVCQSLAEMVGSSASVYALRSLQDLLSALEGCSYVIAERYHGALAAVILGIRTEVIAQHAGDKLDALAGVRTSSERVRHLRTQAREGEEELRKFMNMVK